MALSERGARLLMGGIVAALLAAVWTVKIPQFWGDGATFYTMAWSLAEDLDLRYEARDVFRVRREFPSGPQGIFLKRASGGLAWDAERFPWVRRVPPDEPRVYFAKASLHPLVAAPFVRLLGTRGLLVLNVLAFGVTLFLAYGEIRRHATPAQAVALSLVLLLGTVTPIYLLWPTPEVLGMALVAGGLCAWRRGWPLLAAVVLGLATYLKPYSLFLALPLGVGPLLGPGALTVRLKQSVRRGLVLAFTVAALFGLNAAATGEINYQGGERKTFYGRFPFESHDVTFGNSGQWMTTDHLGPLVEGEDEAQQSRRTGPLRPKEEIQLSFIRNLGYFWVGRFGGALPYFFPVALAAIAFAAGRPRDTPGWLALAALVVSYLFYIVQIPDNWYGGGGTVGNRYFLNLLPLAFFFVARGREWLVAVAGLLVSAIFLAPVWMAPLAHSLRPGDHAMRRPLLALPPELTMLNDLSVFTEAWRKKQPYGDTEGDPHRHWPADPKAYWLYFTDHGTYGKEALGAQEGFWLRGGERGEVILRSLEPMRRVTLRATGGPAGDEVTVKLGGREERLVLGPGEGREAYFEPGRGFPYYDSFLHVLRLRSRRAGQEPPPLSRNLGAFVSISLEVDRRLPRP